MLTHKGFSQFELSTIKDGDKFLTPPQTDCYALLHENVIDV